MPIYEYQCPVCKKIYEEFGKMEDIKKIEKNLKCDKCKEELKRILSTYSFSI